MRQSEDYKRGYQDALTKIRNEIDQWIAEKEKLLERFSSEDYVSSIASAQHEIKVGLSVAKIIIDKEIEQ